MKKCQCNNRDDCSVVLLTCTFAHVLVTVYGHVHLLPSRSQNDTHLWWCLVESVIRQNATVHQQRWIVPAVVGDVSMLTRTCMSVCTHRNKHMCTCTIDAWAFKGTATGYISHVPQ